MYSTGMISLGTFMKSLSSQMDSDVNVPKPSRSGTTQSPSSTSRTPGPTTSTTPTPEQPKAWGGWSCKSSRNKVSVPCFAMKRSRGEIVAAWMLMRHSFQSTVRGIFWKTTSVQRAATDAPSAPGFWGPGDVFLTIVVARTLGRRTFS